MGRRSSVATVAATTAVSSPSSSRETSFRELDDVFLQTQTRIWLGEVLKIRLDEQLCISDLLADGELLFEVSKIVWSLLLEKCVELRQIKTYQSPVGSKKSSGRYKPYSNVDSFLKVCKILGLNGIDLFSPSDVVEKRNTRKVCICIRAISKKARSKHLNVLDFDSVTNAVAMPTEMVGYIRRSLESSQCSVSSCSSNNSYKQTGSRTQQRTLTSSPHGNYDSYSEESDEAESHYFGTESLPEKSGHAATLDLDMENSPDAFSAINFYKTSQFSLQSDTQSYYRDGKPCLRQHLGNDLRNSPSSAGCFRAQADVRHDDMHTNNDLRDRSGSISELAEVDLVLRNEDPELRNSIADDLAGANYISDYLAFSDSVIFGNNGNILFPDGEDNVCDFFTSIDSRGLDSIQGNSSNGFHQRTLDDMEDVEVSSTASMSSILGRALNMDFDDQYNGRDSSMVNVHSIIESHDKETDSREKCSITEDRTQASLQHDDDLSQSSTTDIEEAYPLIHFKSEGNLAKIISFPEEIGQPHMKESQKLYARGDSLDPEVAFSMENASLAENEKSFMALDSKKLFAPASDLSPNFNHECSSHTSLDSVHHEICMEGKVSCYKGSLESNGSLIFNLGNKDVIPVENARCLESFELRNGTISSHNITSPVNEWESRTENEPISSNENGKIVTAGGHQTYTDSSRTTHQFSNGNEEVGDENNVDTSNEKISDMKDERCGTRQDKPRRNLLLNTVVTGTTLVGALFFLLHIRKGKEKTDKPPVLVKAQQFVGTKPASRRGQTNKSNGTYPAEKLKFGS